MKTRTEIITDPDEVRFLDIMRIGDEFRELRMGAIGGDAALLWAHGLTFSVSTLRQMMSGPNPVTITREVKVKEMSLADWCKEAAQRRESIDVSRWSVRYCTRERARCGPGSVSANAIYHESLTATDWVEEE